MYEMRIGLTENIRMREKAHNANSNTSTVYEPYRALLKLTTQLDGLSYYTRVWQGTIGSIFGVPTVPYSALQSLYLGQYKLLILYPRNLIIKLPTCRDNRALVGHCRGTNICSYGTLPYPWLV